jgi:hypothetical protein
VNSLTFGKTAGVQVPLKQNRWYHNIYILQAAHRSEEIFILMEGQRGIYIIKFPHFTLIIQEKDLGRQGNHEEAVFDGFSA